MDINNDDLSIIKDLLFQNEYSLYDLQYNAFHQFLDVDVIQELKNKNVFYETKSINGNFIYKYKLKYGDLQIKPPMSNNNEYMWPNDARKKHLSYVSKIFSKVQQVQEIHNVITGEITEKNIGDAEVYEIAKIPIMVKSRYCTTNLLKGKENQECKYDPGCYFIINGNEKVIIGLEKISNNKILVFKKKDITFPENYTYISQINSKYEGYNENIQILSIKMKKDLSIYVQTMIFNEVPLFIFLRALGFETDKEIFEKIVHNLEDNEMINILKYSVNKILFDQTKPKGDDNIEINTQEDAIRYLISKLRGNIRFNEESEELQYIQKKIRVNQILENDILPHMGSDILNKAHFISLMVNKYLQVYLNRTEIDDRDSYSNKRIDLPGNLMLILFKQYYKKMLNDINKYFKKKNYPYPGDDEPINVLNQIKPNVIEQGMKNSLMTGNWGISKKKGVSQVLQRYNFLQTLSFIRRFNSPSLDASSGKVTNIRHVHPDQYGYVCPVETPDGAKVGLVKNLALTATVTLNNDDQNDIIINLIKNYIIIIKNIKYFEIDNFIKVFINGKWLGITNDYDKILNIINSAKHRNIIDYTITSFLDYKKYELKINSDNGRLIRPLLKVKNNKLYLTKDIINNIKSTNIKDKIKTWNELLIKDSKIIEYVDVEYSNNCMIAMTLKDLKINSNRKNTLIKNPNPYGDKVNRYNDTVYVNYTHCEIHPSLYLGTTSSNIPFCEHNQGPRNIYNYSQSRQAMGIYATNERHRMDITYRLMHPQVPLVITQSMKYLKTLNMPAGENCIVAICCYGGYNQEDSVVLNGSSLQRGMFRSFVLKKYSAEIQKNPNSAQDDIFMKPDRDSVISMKDNNYDKLNDKGYVPEETAVNNKDVIIGKVSPIKPGNNIGEIYKDESVSYKSGESGIIDKVNYGIINNDGYEMCDIKVRSERIPKIGDKVCSRHGQKGTGGIILDSVDMPFSKEGVQPDIIVNPNALPSRMTIGQLLESLIGKVGIIRGEYVDATPFNEINLDEAFDILEKNGYNKYGYETLYCGMTGKQIKSQIFIGPTYYLRLKHLVQEKIHSRAKGPKTILTRQPSEGRTKDGGLRFGEMERDCMISHGMGQFLKERLVDTSDLYYIYVCSSCGLFASKMIDKDIYTCKVCEINKKDYTAHKVAIPYAFKLLIQELQTINILPRIKVERNIYND